MLISTFQKNVLFFICQQHSANSIQLILVFDEEENIQMFFDQIRLKFVDKKIQKYTTF